MTRYWSKQKHPAAAQKAQAEVCLLGTTGSERSDRFMPEAGQPAVVSIISRTLGNPEEGS